MRQRLALALLLVLPFASSEAGSFGGDGIPGNKLVKTELGQFREVQIRKFCSSPNIVIGKTTSGSAFYAPGSTSERPIIMTKATLEVEVPLRGSSPQNLPLYLGGGEIDGFRQSYSGMMSPSVGQRYLMGYLPVTSASGLLSPGDPSVRVFLYMDPDLVITGEIAENFQAIFASFEEKYCG